MRSHFFLGFFIAICLVACASFNFDRYGWDYAHQKLLHYETADKDLPTTVCDNGDGKFKCVVLFSSDFYRLKTDYEAMSAALKLCQKGQ